MPNRHLPLFPLFFFLVAELDSQTERVTGPQELWSVHAQATAILQAHPGFASPYSGRNSFSQEPEAQPSLTATLFLGRRLWNGSEAYINPEITAGKGLSGTVGMAGFPNGEIYRVGDPAPQLSIARVFLRQTWSLGDENEQGETDENRLAGSVPLNRIVLTLGKFSLTDIFDDNRFSHDPRTQFMNWALMFNGAWDYPADTKGYTWGLAFEYVSPKWALRLCAAMEPKEANGIEMDPNVLKAHGESLEIGLKHELFGRGGNVRMSAYLNSANMGSYAESFQTGNPPNIVLTRSYGRIKYGVLVNAEQEISENAGAFVRVGWDDGKTETWAFTEIDRTVSLGYLVRGQSWSRADDQLGIALALNGLSDDHRSYLEAGGYGFMIGDGKLHYAPEIIAETFYSLRVLQGLFFTGDYQLAVNPAYNGDRGPVSIFSGRFHFER